MAAPKTKTSSRRNARSQSARAEAGAAASISTLAAVTADTLETVLAKIDSEVFRELKVIAAHIQTLRREIAELQPSKMHRESIPAAGLELDAIVSATESASNTILECAEQVMAADASDPKRYKALVEKKMLRVFEACSFQDLTGQRIAKVVETLKQIEARVARFAKAARADSGGRKKPPVSARANSQAAIDRIIGTKRR